MKKSFQNKLQSLLMRISMISLGVTFLCVMIGGGVLVYRVFLNNMEFGVNVQMSSTDQLEEQIQKQLLALAQDKADTADALVLQGEYQSLLVADQMTEIFINAGHYLNGYDESRLPGFWSDGDSAFTFSVHIRCPKELLVPESIVYGAAYNKNGDFLEDRVIAARINGDLKPGQYTVKEELYLASFLDSALGQIQNSYGEDGSFSGFSATYFCFADSGLDVLADLETQQMIVYDGRGSSWYTGVEEAFLSGGLKEGESYWTDPVPDASGRGSSVICAVPVIVDGQLMGVAGSGGTTEKLAELVANSKIGETGYSFMVSRDSSKVIVNPNLQPGKESEVDIGSVLKESRNQQLRMLSEEICQGRSDIQESRIDGQEVFVAYAPLSNTDWSMVTVVTREDPTIVETVKEQTETLVELSANNLLGLIGITSIIFIVLLAVLGVTLFGVIVSARRFAVRFTRPLLELKEGVEIISAGNLDHQMEIKTGDEVELLGNAFNRMAAGLKEYIANLAAVMSEKERIGAELSVATQIQADMLPQIFPAFPHKEEFDIYATMTPAKEVGGDFYDFFLVDEDHLAVVMADVSDKGVPAALFMVIAKTLIKNHVQQGESPAAAFMHTNNQLCEGNNAALFVTAWLGVLEFSTGIVTYVNAGHEPPAICRQDGGYEYLKEASGFVLAGIEDMTYEQATFLMKPGDMLYLYTDGVTEATDAKEELYGFKRLLTCLNRCIGQEPRELLTSVQADIDGFVKEAPQFDDITMLALKFKSFMERQELTVPAAIENIPRVTEWVDNALSANEKLLAVQAQVDIAIDEILSNVVYYSGSEDMSVRMWLWERQVKLAFVDSGAPYNPLEQENPDVTLPAVERKVGGLGIYMVKKMMDAVEYRYENGKNIVTVTAVVKES